ncbi:ATP-dependent RecD-like DNA helicase [compost metagenome]
MKLNAGQTAAVERAVSGFLESDLKGLTIIGEGGTGKTTCVMTIAERLLAAGLKVLFTAPTNKAVKQLEKAARRHGLTQSNVAFQTLHSAIGLTMLPSEEQKYAARTGKGVFPLFDVVVVDEASMLGKRVTFDYMMPEAIANEVRLLLMGDDMQLPPVKEAKSPAFEIFETVRLTQVERQSGDSGILTVTGALRTAMDSRRPFVAPPTPKNGVESLKAADFMKYVVDQFDEHTDLDDQRVLAWRNQRVDEINRAIRQKIYGKGAARFEEGERLVTAAPIGNGESILLSTDEECILHSVRESYIEDDDSGETFRTWCLVLNPIHADVKQVITHVLHESEQERYDARLRHFSDLAKKAGPQGSRGYWARYHKFKELFSHLRYCYCITVHRAQGSTYKRVFVDVKDILGNTISNERQRLLYVAYSRPSEVLVINKEKYVA